MASKAPPVPPAQRSRGTARTASPVDRHAEVAHDPAGGNAHFNLKEQGRYGAMHQNIVHQGRQQDR